MAKMRVHELAKEIDKNNKDVLDVLQANGVNVQSPLSVIDEAQADMVRRAYAPKPEKTEAPAEEKKEEQAVPKKRITAVFRSQNSSQAGRSKGPRPAVPGAARRAQGTRPAGAGQRPGTRPAGPRPVMKAAPEGAETEAKAAGTTQEAPKTAERTQNTQGSRERQNGQRSFDANRRPGGDRNSQGGQRSFDGNRRPGGDRNSQGGQRSFDGNRRPGGDRNSQGGQRSFDGNRRPGGDRNSQGGQMNRDGRRGTSRPGDSRKGGGFAVPAPGLDSTQKNTGKQKQNSRQNNKYDKKQEEDFGKKPGKRGGKGVKPPVKAPEVKAEPVVEEIKTIVIPETLTIKELADKMKLQPSAIVKKLFLQGKVVTINQEVDYETAEEIAMEFDVLCEKEVKVDVIEELLKDEDDPEDTLVARPPVVCVMGHVDHGKTSLLDAIRSTNVIAREAGGITQHIGASVVEVNGQKITFLDTPGHEAFTAMRMRGAQATDIAILVVAADDGVMPQTVEAINHAKAAGVEIIVAVNKIDKPSANVDRVKQELSEYELVPEDWGGTTIFVPVSAHTKEGIENLLEMILLTAEVKELKANPNRRARGLVIEAELDKGKGPVATILVQKGTLHVGDAIAAGPCHGKVRAMMDDKGRRVKEAGPSTPVEILGLNDVPSAGEIFVAPENEKEARSFAETFISEGKEKLLADTKAKLSLDDLFDQIKAGNVKELGIIIKADVQGSVEAVKQSLTKLSNEEVVVKVIHGGVGAINESDVSLASASNAIIIGFNVRPDATAKSIAEREKVDIRLYKVIYQAIEDVEAAMKGMLDPVFEEQVIGHAVVRQLFKASGVGTIAGSYVLDGKIQRGCSVRITREGEQIFEGPLASLKRFKDDVKEVAKGFECGFVFEGFNDIKEDDMVEAYIMVEVPR
ncbi:MULTISPECIES: translation initiation factor IF-2 [unclassified Candidatus Paralachnospira]|uniref:translation initiation factor IF-2 n=1 Tax=unclassified Candidatus Paralachnospira TaxID=3099471 RepID=UPI003F929A4F